MEPAPSVALPRLNDRPNAGGSLRAISLAYLTFAILACLTVAVCFALNLDPFTASGRAHRAVPIAALLLLSSMFGLVLSRLAPLVMFQQGLRALRNAPRWAIAVFALAIFLAAAYVAAEVLRGAPISGDETSYLFQASVFRLGRLWMHPSPIQRYVDSFYVFDIQGKLVSQYPPGWAALLALAESAGIAPWLLNPILGAFTIIALYVLGMQSHGREAAILSVAICGVSGFFLLNSASLFNHSLVALGGVLFVIASVSFLRSAGLLAATSMGLCFSAVAVTRHYEAILLALPVAIIVLLRGGRQHWFRVPVIALAAAPVLGGLLVYYGAITGNPLQTPQTLMLPYDGLLGPYFSVSRATEIAFGRGIELAEWISPPFVVAYLWALARTAAQRKLNFFDLYGLVFLLGYWLYWGDGGLRWGPRYIFPAFPFMALTLAAAIVDAIKTNDLRARSRFFIHLALASIIVALIQTSFLAAAAGRVMNEFEDVYDAVGRAQFHKAVVLLVSGTGVTWKMPVGGLVRNGATLDGDVIYAHAGNILAQSTDPDRTRTALDDLRAFFPDRAMWLYRRDDRQIHGELVATP